MTPGAQLGPYQLLAQIGEGGMGEVWKARDTRLDRTVALKISKDEFTERFEREARAIAALNHPNICQLYDVGPNYLVMELVEGQPLKGPLPVEKAVEYASQILDALDAAHKKGIVHRDLKPANILVTRQGIKLLDFGLAKQSAAITQTDATLTKALTTEGQIAGTLQYMAPEQLHAKEADARSDIFAFGCVLYELISGNNAFQGESAASIIAAILEREPAPLQLTPPLGRVIAKCLAKSPEDRFQGARDLKTALHWALQTSETRSAPIPKWRWAIALALLLLVSGGIGLILGLRGNRKSEQSLRMSILPPPGIESVDGIALSPDGSKLAMVAGNRIWNRDLRTGTYQPVNGTEGASSMCWSPDSTQLAFASQFSGKFKRTAVAGGEPVTLLDTDRGECSWEKLGDSESIVVWTSKGIRKIDPATKTAVPLRLDIGGEGPHLATAAYFVPGGRFLAYAAIDAADRPLRLRSISTGEEKALMSGVGNYHLAFSNRHMFYAQSTSLWARGFDPENGRWTGEAVSLTQNSSMGVNYNSPFTASHNGTVAWLESPLQQAYWVDRSGRRTVVSDSPRLPANVRISPDGTRAAFTAGERGVLDLWIYDIGRGVSSRLTRSPLNEGSPVWTPDGKRIYFYSTKAGLRDLFSADAAGTGVEELVYHSPKQKQIGDISSDGSSMLFTEIVDGTYLIQVMPLKNSAPATPAPYLNESFTTTHPRFSPDGRWVAYATDEGGRREVYVQSFPRGRGKWKVSGSAGGSYPVWSRDGSELFYYELESARMMSVAVRKGADLQFERPAPLFEIRFPGSLAFPYDVSPDGKRFLVCEEPPSRSVSVITNYQDSAK